MYKRMSPRDYTVVADVEDSSGKFKYLSSQVIQCILVALTNIEFCIILLIQLPGMFAVHWIFGTLVYDLFYCV